MGLEYVDIFYSHRFDPETPLRGDDGRARRRRACRQGALRRHLLLRSRAHRRGRAHPARAGHAAADPPAVLLDAQPLDRGRAARRARARRRRRDRLLAAGAGPAHRPLPDGVPEDSRVRRGNSFSEPRCSASENLAARARAQRDRRASAGSRSRRWRSPGCCATSASPPRCSAPAACASSSRTWPRCRRLDFDERRARGDRPPRAGRRHQPVGANRARPSRATLRAWHADASPARRRPRRPWPPAR